MLDADLRECLVDRVMARERVERAIAERIVASLKAHDLVRLELEARDHREPAFTADYDPFGRI